MKKITLSGLVFGMFLVGTSLLAQEKKQIKGLEALEKRLLKAEKKVHKDYIERLESIHLELFPSGGLQERFTNFSEFYIEHGDAFIESLKSELIPLNQKFHVLTL